MARIHNCPELQWSQKMTTFFDAFSLILQSLKAQLRKV